MSSSFTQESAPVERRKSPTSYQV